MRLSLFSVSIALCIIFQCSYISVLQRGVSSEYVHCFFQFMVVSNIDSYFVIYFGLNW